MRSNDSQKIIAVGIPKSMDDAGLSELFSGFGTVAEAKVVLDANSGASRGFGFVTFTASSAMRAAIKGMNKKKVEDRVLNVRQLVPKDKFQQQKQSDESADPSKRPCWLLRKGKCTKGDSCPFSHETQDGEFGSCFEFAQTGACKRGDACKFYHPPASGDAEGGDDSSSKPKAAADDKKKGKAGDKGKSDDKPKKRVCYAFQSGRCHRGKGCMFVHEKLPADAAPEAKQDKKKAAPTKKAGDFEIVANSAGDAARKRTRDEMEGAPVEDDSETESEDGSDDVVMKQETRQQPQKAVKPQPKPVRNTGKAAATANTNKPSEAKEKAAPLAGLAAHVATFMKQQLAAKPTASAPATADKKTAKPTEQPRRRDAPTPSAKRQKTERVDMGAAFDGLSDDDEPRAAGGNKRGRKPVDKEAMKAAREKAKEDRRAKRSAKKQALSRLKTKGKVDLETGT